MLICQILTVLSVLLKIVKNKNNNDPCFFHNCFWNKNLENEFPINKLSYTNDEIEIQFHGILNLQIIAPYRDQLNRDQLKACEECIESFKLISEWYFSDYNSLKCFNSNLIHTKPTISLIHPSALMVQIKLAIPVRNEQTITFQENGARYLLGMHILDDRDSYMNILQMSFHKVYFETDWKTTIVSFKLSELTNSPRVLFRHPMRIETELLLKIFEGFATYNNVRIYGNAKISQDFPYLKNRFSTVIQFSDDYKFKDNNDLPELKQIEEPKKENNQIQVPQKKKNTMLVIVILVGVVIVLVVFVNYKIMKKTV